MRIYLAGVTTAGNLRWLWDETKGGEMKVYLAGSETRSWIHDKLISLEKEKYQPYVLESFYSSDSVTERQIPYFGDFLLDSGAFTFMMNEKKHVDWNDYLERYADFIIRNKVEKFFELDIDTVVGCEKVKEYRKTLENLVGRKCIPVWHKCRGIEEYKKLCNEYSYIAIGGVVTKEIKVSQYQLFPSMISYAHKNNCRVHGLGFTRINLLKEYHFDSVDSTSWTCGNRFGIIFKYENGTMKKTFVPKGKRLADSRQIALINYTEWLKFQQYADKNL